MKAFTYDAAHPLESFAVRLTERPAPVPRPGDLLVRVKAFSFNPVDTKVRRSRSGTAEAPVILGWDAAGIVEAVGPEARGFAVGDRVYYAGDLTRDGAYAEWQAVDHRLVARAPAGLDFAQAAALPLTALTAWEALFEHGIDHPPGSRALIIGGAGGVGSIAIQLLKALTPAEVIATASRPETVEWCRRLGADRVVGRDLAGDLAALGGAPLDVVFSTTHTDQYLGAINAALRPFGSLCLIDDPATLDILPFKRKAQSVHWEFMFAKSMHGYRPETQGVILARVAALVEAGTVVSTLNRTLPATDAAMHEAHTIIEAGAAIGKIAMVW